MRVHITKQNRALRQQSALVCAWQLSEAVLLQTANEMFHEGQGKPRTVAKDGGAAPLINALLINAKAAVASMWKARGYDPKKPEVIKSDSCAY